MVTTEKRAFRRIELFAQVQVSRDKEVYVMATENISLGGLFVNGAPTDHPDITIGSEVELQIFAAEEIHDGDVSCRARVVRIEGGGRSGRAGFGLEFTALDVANRERIKRLLFGVARS